MATPIFCDKCGSQIKFREWGKRYPPKSEALGDCPNCGKVQVRFWEGKQTSDVYQVRRKEKSERGSHRLNKERKTAIIAVWGSVQKYLDHSVVQIGMTQQYKS